MLDNNTTEKLLPLLQRYKEKVITIQIVSYDNQVIATSDFVYEIDDFQLNLIEKTDSQCYSFLITFLIALTLALLIPFLNKSYLTKSNKELAVLYSLGYSRIQLIKLILAENFIIFSLCFMSAYLIDALLFKYSLRQPTYFSSIQFMFQWTAVLSTMLSILFFASI
ncbi:FtsX-like permease family protein [Tuanshanicoccus lijuaniae]|uniref:FtsX-like permease family protein n=1 Tax=Aerococcaceae bacterium zg-1292 TaxID=2774330 RepID=UPI001BD8A263|nr:FtsX-like permease family protein [Aerococcaceae bacterium zg-A91]MBS4457568.1 FtsX-like permease family protein [Aerococcaceae bacterium zg-BR33]